MKLCRQYTVMVAKQADDVLNSYARALGVFWEPDNDINLWMNALDQNTIMKSFRNY